jgi:hypothetical protein
MDLLKSTFQDFWKNEFPKLFYKGLITYERQLQAEIYCWLKSKLTDSYKVWVEPNIVLPNTVLHDKKPDLVITSENKIKAIVEIKYTLFDSRLKYDEDLKKLADFNVESKKGHSLVFGYLPINNAIANERLYSDLAFEFNSDYHNIIILFSNNSIDLHRLKAVPNDHINSQYLNSLNNLFLLTGNYSANESLQLKCE